MGHIPHMSDIIFPIQKLIYMTKRQATLVKDFRFSQRLESDNEAIRQLIDLGLESTLADDTPSESYNPGTAPKAKEAAK